MPVNWNPWHGCRKFSAGCRNCYVFRSDARYGRPLGEIRKTADFDLPLRRKRDGSWKIASDELVWTCFTSDFLLAEADEWRSSCWEMMRLRQDLTFLFITKRIERLTECVPPDWGDGYPNVRICCTMENQQEASYRLPIFRQAPIKWKAVVCEPMLGPINLQPYLGSWVREVVAGGESGEEARPCNFDWILDLRRQCVQADVRFHFKQTGARFIKDGRGYRVPRRQQHSQARKANIEFFPSENKFTY